MIRQEKSAVGAAMGLNIGQAVYATMIQVWVLSYATSELGIARGTILTGSSSALLSPS